jgi:hypothetical protein
MDTPKETLERELHLIRLNNGTTTTTQLALVAAKLREARRAHDREALEAAKRLLSDIVAVQSSRVATGTDDAFCKGYTACLYEDVCAELDPDSLAYAMLKAIAEQEPDAESGKLHSLFGADALHAEEVLLNAGLVRRLPRGRVVNLETTADGRRLLQELKQQTPASA